MLRPFDLTNNEIELPEELNNILANSGLAEKQDSTLGENKIINARSVFNKHGAKLEDAARTISSIMKNAENENSRLKASELVLKVHGILNEIDEAKSTQININITGESHKTLVNLVLPTL